VPSKRSGLSEPRLFNLPPLRFGARVAIRVGENDQKKLIMISAIVSRNGETELFLLITPQTDLPAPKGKNTVVSLVRSRGLKPLIIGHLLSADDQLARNLSPFGLRVIRLLGTALFEIGLDSTREISHVTSFRECLWGKGVFRVRRVNSSPAEPDIAATSSSEFGRMSNRPPRTVNVRGRVCGEVERVKFQQTSDTLLFPYCALVVRGGGKKIGEASSLGAPLISKNGALAAVIVGSSDEEVLVLPFEEIQKAADVQFRSFGEDWPKVLSKTPLTSRAV
jgi:hypothetical protein